MKKMFNNKTMNYIKNNPKVSFFIICLSGIAAYIVASFMYGGDMMTWIVQENNPNIRFVDYFMHIRYASNPSGLYGMVADDTQGCFPPLAYVLYYFLNRLTCRKFDGDIPNREDFEYITGTYLVYVYYTIFVALLIFVGIVLLSKKGESVKSTSNITIANNSNGLKVEGNHNNGCNDKRVITDNNSNIARSVLIFVCIMMSCPFMGSGFLVGNSAMLVFGLLLIFFALRNHESKVVREIAMIILAICAGMKIYPAVFGLLYLKEKKWKEAVRLIIYGILFFFVPFAFFGGVNGMLLWLGHIKGTMKLMESYRIEYIKGVTYIILPHLGIEVGTKLFEMLCSIMPMLFVLVMIGLAAFSKNEHRTLVFLTAIMAFYPTNAYRYSLAYMAIPLIMWLQSGKEGDLSGERTICQNSSWDGAKLEMFAKIEEWVKAIFYGMIFAIPVLWGIITSFRLNFDHVHMTYVEVWIYLMAYVFLGVEVIIQVLNLFNKKHKSNQESIK